jgi:hypothetical protein
VAVLAAVVMQTARLPMLKSISEIQSDHSDFLEGKTIWAKLLKLLG